MERLRVITNYFTRMRICKDDGTLDLHFKKSRAEIPEGFQPWFEFHSHDSLQGATVHFGHWAALESQCYHTRFNALDSGCVWGKQLTLYAKESRARFHYNCGCETS